MGLFCSHHHKKAKEEKTFHKSFAVGVALNSIFVVIEVIFGFMSNSLALLADAIHNFGDVLALLLAWLGYHLAFQKPNHRFTYGMGRVSIFATLFNGASLVVTSAWIVWEAWLRLQDPIMPDNKVVAIVATIGIAVNTVTGLFLLRGKEDVNIKGAMIHMFADAAISAGVVVTAGLMAWLGWLWLDPAISSLIAIVILIISWPILREGFFLSLDAVPHQVDRAAIQHYFDTHPDVKNVYDLHVWGLSTIKTALSAHVEIKEDRSHESALRSLHRGLKSRFGVNHVTIQVEHSHRYCTDEHELKD